MAYTLQSLVSEAKRNKLSLIASLKEEDVVLVWDAVAEFIEKQMAQQKVREEEMFCSVHKFIIVTNHIKIHSNFIRAITI